MLQQKREESEIQMCSQMENFRIIELANGSSNPISPNKMQVYVISLLLGLLFPFALVWVRMQLRSYVETKKDITSNIDDTLDLASALELVELLRILIDYRSGIAIGIEFISSRIAFDCDGAVACEIFQRRGIPQSLPRYLLAVQIHRD